MKHIDRIFSEVSKRLAQKRFNVCDIVAERHPSPDKGLLWYSDVTDILVDISEELRKGGKL